MVITNIIVQDKNKNRYSIFIDDAFAFGIDGKDLLYYKLKKGQHLSLKTFCFLKDELEYIRARDRAVKYLGHSPKSRAEVIANLTQKGFSLENIEKVVSMLSGKGYIDDIKFAKIFINHKLKINNFAKKRIITELLLKGLRKEDILEAFEQFEAENMQNMQSLELEAAQLALNKKIKHKNLPTDLKEKQRLVNFLLRKGFSYQTIENVIKQEENK